MSQDNQMAQEPQDLASLAEDFRVKHPRFSQAATTTPEPVDLSGETIPEKSTEEAPEEKLYLAQQNDRTRKSWKESSSTRLMIMGALFGGAALVFTFAFSMKMPEIRTATVEMAKKKNAAVAEQDPEVATDGEFAAQGALASQDGVFDTAKNAEGNSPLSGLRKNGKNAKNAKDSSSKKVQMASRTGTPNIRRSPSRTMAYAAPVRYRSSVPQDYDLPPRTPRPTAQAVARPAAVPSMSPASSIANAQKEQDPNEAWMEAAGVGTVQSDSKENGDPSMIASAETSSSPVSQSQTVPSLQNASFTEDAPGAPQPQFQNAAFQQSEEAMLSGQPQTLIARGTAGTGKLAQAIAWTPDLKSRVEAQTVDVELSEALGVLPKGTRIIAKPSLSDEGLAVLDAVAIDIGGQQIPVPSGAVLLQTSNGPLVGKQVGKGSSFLKVLGSIGAGVLGAVSQNALQPESQSIIQGPGGFSSSTQFGNGSLLGAVGKGVADPLIQMLQSSSNSTQGEQRKLWIVKPGQTLQVRIEQPIAVPDTAVKGQPELMVQETESTEMSEEIAYLPDSLPAQDETIEPEQVQEPVAPIEAVPRDEVQIDFYSEGSVPEEASDDSIAVPQL
jgi:hypothetical protein